MLLLVHTVLFEAELADALQIGARCVAKGGVADGQLDELHALLERHPFLGARLEDILIHCLGRPAVLITHEAHDRPACCQRPVDDLEGARAAAEGNEHERWPGQFVAVLVAPVDRVTRLSLELNTKLSLRSEGALASERLARLRIARVDEQEVRMPPVEEDFPVRQLLGGRLVHIPRAFTLLLVDGRARALADAAFAQVRKSRWGSCGGTVAELAAHELIALIDDPVRRDADARDRQGRQLVLAHHHSDQLHHTGAGATRDDPWHRAVVVLVGLVAEARARDGLGEPALEEHLLLFRQPGTGVSAARDRDDDRRLPEPPVLHAEIDEILEFVLIVHADVGHPGPLGRHTLAARELDPAPLDRNIARPLELLGHPPVGEVLGTVARSIDARIGCFVETQWLGRDLDDRGCLSRSHG